MPFQGVGLRWLALWASSSLFSCPGFGSWLLASTPQRPLFGHSLAILWPLFAHLEPQIWTLEPKWAQSNPKWQGIVRNIPKQKHNAMPHTTVYMILIWYAKDKGEQFHTSSVRCEEDCYDVIVTHESSPLFLSINHRSRTCIKNERSNFRGSKVSKAGWMKLVLLVARNRKSE